MNLRPTRVLIDLKNLRHNCRTLRELHLQVAQDKKQREFFCPMLKADAYGHGVAQVAKALTDEGVNHFGVATVEEGIELRNAIGDKATIFVFSPVMEVAVNHYFEARLTPMISSWREAEILAKTARSPLSVHLKFNTGMCRLGLPPHEAEKMAKFIAASEHLKLEGVCTHFSDGEDAHQPGGATHQQIEKFRNILQSFRASSIYHHAFNSSALIATAVAQKKIDFGARPGIALFGAKPKLFDPNSAESERWSAIDLKPVMGWESAIILTQNVSAGDSVSYNRRWTSESGGQIAVIPVGYADGYHRRLSNKSRMLVRGQAVPVVGIVCMDYTMVDVTALGLTQQDLYGESVTILGQQGDASIDAAELATIIETNPYEILTSVSRRVPRVYK